MPTPAHIDYIELYAVTTAPLKDFYSRAFGWTFQDYGEKYAGFSDGSTKTTEDPGEAGGINALGTHDTPLVVLRTDDLDGAYQSVIDAGGEILGEIDSFPGGKRFLFRDPAGNKLAVWIKF